MLLAAADGGAEVDRPEPIRHPGQLQALKQRYAKQEGGGRWYGSRYVIGSHQSGREDPILNLRHDGLSNPGRPLAAPLHRGKVTQ